jgi:DNA processing protein
LDNATIENILGCRPKISPDDEMESIHKYGVRVLTFISSDYPKLLLESGDYPPVLYIRGELKAEDEFSLAVVGTRRATAYGKQVAEEIVHDLARNKITIISGLASGIDTIAHRTALEAGGRTIAVFASGLDIVYPRENLNLARRVVESGALISEYPLGIKPMAEHFPLRNRILSGLSRGVLVVESGEKGGALITANFALEQNREVFAVPGSVFSAASRGTNNLIQAGAKLVRHHMDILEELNISCLAAQLELPQQQAIDETESNVIKCITAEPVHIDEICRLSNLDTSVVSSTLTLLELKGLVRHTGNMCYALKKNLR